MIDIIKCCCLTDIREESMFPLIQQINANKNLDFQEYI